VKKVVDLNDVFRSNILERRYLVEKPTFFAWIVDILDDYFSLKQAVFADIDTAHASAKWLLQQLIPIGYQRRHELF
jgi:hypothetical protein